MPTLTTILRDEGDCALDKAHISTAHKHHMEFLRQTVGDRWHFGSPHFLHVVCCMMHDTTLAQASSDPWRNAEIRAFMQSFYLRSLAWLYQVRAELFAPSPCLSDSSPPCPSVP